LTKPSNHRLLPPDYLSREETNVSVTVRKAISSDMYPVCKLLRESTLNSNWIGVNVRKRMFQDPWAGGEDYFGYVMLDGEEIVGFLGMV